MSSVFFFLKTTLFTFIIVLILQVKVKEKTLETQTLFLIKNSSLIQPLQELSLGSLLLAKASLQKILNHIQSKFYKTNMPLQVGERHSKFKLQRSQQALQNENQKQFDPPLVVQHSNIAKQAPSFPVPTTQKSISPPSEVVSSPPSFPRHPSHQETKSTTLKPKPSIASLSPSKEIKKTKALKPEPLKTSLKNTTLQKSSTTE